MNMSKLRNKGLMICEIKPKPKALKHFKVEAVQKFDDSGLSISQWDRIDFDMYLTRSSQHQFSISIFFNFCP